MQCARWRMGDLRTNETPRALLGALLQSTDARNDVNRRHEDTDVGILEFRKANIPGFSRDVRSSEPDATWNPVSRPSLLDRLRSYPLPPCWNLNGARCSYGLSTLSTSRTTVGVWLLDVAALEPGVAPGRRTAVSTEPAICTPGCGPYDEPAGAVAPRCVGIAR